MVGSLTWRRGGEGECMDWTDVLLSSAAYASTAERVKAFVGQGGGCRATFFNCRHHRLM